MRIIDSHQHLFSFGGVDSVSAMLHKGWVDKIAMMAATIPVATDMSYKNSIFEDGVNLLQNPLMMYLKALWPEKVYIFGGLHHDGNVKGFADYKTQAERLMALGFDGVKMLEGLPSSRTQLWYNVDEEEYDPFFSYLEENGIMCTLHLGSVAYAYPEEFMQDSWKKMCRIMEKHPKLKMNWAHLGSRDYYPEQAEEFLTRWENTTFDLVPHYDMYNQFSKNIKSWRGFFLKFADRLMYGTDLGGALKPDEWNPDINIDLPLYEYESNWLKHVLTDKEFDGMRRLELPDDVLEKIFYKNFENHVSKFPKALNFDLAIEECEKQLEYAKQSCDRERNEIYLKFYIQELKSMQNTRAKKFTKDMMPGYLPKEYPEKFNR